MKETMRIVTASQQDITQQVVFQSCLAVEENNGGDGTGQSDAYAAAPLANSEK